jgi:S-adenosylmethionine hydrolase
MIDDYRRPADLTPVRSGKRQWNGTVLKVDRFGNLITNLRAVDFPEVLNRPFTLLAGVTAVERLVNAYAEADPAEPVVIVGSSGYLEVVINQESAARALGCGAGAPIELTLY